MLSHARPLRPKAFVLLALNTMATNNSTSPSVSPPLSPSHQCPATVTRISEHKALFLKVLKELLHTNPSEEQVMADMEALARFYCEDCSSYRCYYRYEEQGLLCPATMERLYEESAPFRALFQEVLEELQSTNHIVMS